MNRLNYYDAKFMILSIRIECVEMKLFNLVNVSRITCSSTIWDWMILLSQEIFLIFNLTYETAANIGKWFTTADVDAMTKAIIMREISFTYSSESQKESRNRVMNSFKCYWKKGKPLTPPSQLICKYEISSSFLSQLIY